MTAFLSSSYAQLVILLALMATLVAIGIYAVRRFRGGAEEEQPVASELITNFSELHSQGELSDQEYRTIKTLLAARLQEELSERGKSRPSSESPDPIPDPRLFDRGEEE